MNRRNRIFHSALTLCLWGVAAVYLFVLIKIVLLKYGWNPGLRSVNWVPFQFVLDFIWGDVSADVSLKNILGNFAIFIPLGVLAPILFPRIDRWWKGMLVGLCVSAIFEALQLCFALGAADVDDLLLNTLGAAGGSGIVFGFFKRMGSPWKVRAAGLCFLCLFGAAGVLSLWLYAPGELPRMVETVNAEALEGLDADSYTYSGTLAHMGEETLTCSNVYRPESGSGGKDMTWPLSPDVKWYRCVMTYQYSPNGNIQKTTCTYDRLNADSAKKAAGESERVFADVWVDEDGLCTAVLLTVYQD